MKLLTLSKYGIDNLMNISERYCRFDMGTNDDFLIVSYLLKLFKINKDYLFVHRMKLH